MSGPGSNYNSIPNTEPGSASLDLENSQIHIDDELQTSDCIPIGLADASAADISLVVRITKQIPDESGTECLQKSMAESDLPDSTLNGSTEINCVKDEDVKTIETASSHEINQNDIATEKSSNKNNLSDDAISPVITELYINSKSLIDNETEVPEIKSNDMPVTEEESLKEHSSSITENTIEEAFLENQTETIAEDTPENLGSTKDIKECVSSSGSVNEFIENEDCIVLESSDLFDEEQNQYSPENIVNPEPVYNKNMESKTDIKESVKNSESIKKLIENEEIVLESDELSQDQDSPENIYDRNMESSKDIKESISSSGSVNELIENEKYMALESGELPEDTTDEMEQDQDSPENVVNPETIYIQSMESAKDIKESVSSSESIEKCVETDACVLLESGELSQDTTVDVKQLPVKASEESEDLEDGEVSDDDESVPVKVPVCRFYVRNGCSWGNNCRFRHPGTNKKGNYVMFENKVLPVVSAPFPPAWTPIPPAYLVNLSNVKNDRYYIQDPPEGPKRAPLLPTPSFNDILLAQKNYTKLEDLKRPVRNLDRPQPVARPGRQSISSPCPTAFQWPPGRTRSPSASPPRRDHHVPLVARPTDTATLTSKPSIKRGRLPSPLRFSASRIRGPRTPPCSPSIRPSASVQTAPKRQRYYSYSSSSTDSSDSSSYTSTTESSEESSSSSSSDSDSDSDDEYRSRRKQPSKIHAKSPSGAATKCSSRRQEPSVKKPTPRHTSKSKSRNQSRVPTSQPRKLLGDGNSSYSSRREYLLMKLLQVEKLIAKKKKKMNMK